MFQSSAIFCLVLCILKGTAVAGLVSPAELAWREDTCSWWGEDDTGFKWDFPTGRDN